MYHWWLERVNFESLTRKIYAAALPFPLSYLVRSRLQSEVVDRLAHTDCTSASSAYRIANDVCGALAQLLANAEYFGGDRPCSLDATAFAWLAVAYYAPTPDVQLRDAVRAQSSLVRFVERVLTRHFTQQSRAPKLIAPLAPVKRDAFAAAWDVAVPLLPRLEQSARERRRRQRQFSTLLGAMALCGSFFLTSKLYAMSGATTALST